MARLTGVCGRGVLSSLLCDQAAMSSKRGRGGASGAKFRMTLGLPVAAVINCAGKQPGRQEAFDHQDARGAGRQVVKGLSGNSA